MINTIFRYLGLSILVLTTTQCVNKCQTNPVKDKTRITLQWQEETQTLDLPGLDLTQNLEGKVCYLPSEDATYFINLQGQGWRFTRTPEGTLTAEMIPTINANFQPHEMFVFAAGSKEKQYLFVGNILESIFWKLEDNTWKNYTLFLDKSHDKDSNTMPFPPIAEAKSKIASCSWEDKNQIYGCLLIPFKINDNYHTQLILFDTITNRFKALNPVIPRKFGQIPVEAMSIAPGKILVGYKKSITDEGIYLFSILSIVNDIVTIVPKEIQNPKQHSVAGAFTLQLEDEYPITEPLFYESPGKNYRFLRLNKKNVLVPTKELKSTRLLGNTLMLPFKQNLYCITLNNQNQPIYHQAKLVFKPQKPLKQR